MTAAGQDEVRHKLPSMVASTALLCVPLVICWLLPANDGRWMMLVWPMFAASSALVALIWAHAGRNAEQRAAITRPSPAHVRYSLRGLMVVLALLCVLFAVYRVLPRDAQNWMMGVSPLFVTFSALAILGTSPRRVMSSFALAHALFAVMCLTWASMTNDGELSFVRFVPVYMSNIHLVILGAWLRIATADSFAGLIVLSIVGTAWWAGAGYLVGLAKCTFQRSQQGVK